MLNRAVRGEILHDLSVDVEENFNLVLWQVGVFVLVVQFDRGIEKRLPDFIRVVLLADVDGVVQNLLYFYVGGEVLLVVVVSGLEDAVDSQSGDLH